MVWLNSVATKYRVQRFKYIEIMSKENKTENTQGNGVLAVVSQRSELLKVEDEERSFDEYLEKYFKQPKAELVYKTLYDDKEMTEKEIIRMYKQAHRL